METPSKPVNEDQRSYEPIEPEAKASYDSEVESSSDKSSSSSWTPGSSSSSSTSNTKTFKIVASRERRSVRNIHPPRLVYEPVLPVAKMRKQSGSNTEAGRRGRGRPGANQRQQHIVPAAPKTELELLREKNILDRQNFIEKSGLMKAKEDFDDASKGRPKGSGKNNKKPAPALRERSARRASQLNNALVEMKSQDFSNLKDLSKNLDFNECISSAFTAKDVKIFVDVAKIVAEVWKQRNGPAESKTELELLREKNIHDRNKLMEQCGLMKAKEELDEVIKGWPRSGGKVKSKPQPKLRVTSTRTASQSNNVLGAERSNEISDTWELSENSESKKCMSGFTDDDVQMFLDLAKVVSEETSKMVSETEMSSIQFPVLQSRVQALESYFLCDPELPNNKFTTVAFHPSTSPRLLAAGTKSGSVCLWRITANDAGTQIKSEVVALNVHSGSINQLMFGSNLPHFLYSTGTDGCLKYMDLNKEEFTLLYKLPSKVEDCNWINWTAQLGPNVIVAATSQGTLLRLDTREDNVNPSCSVSTFKCHNFSINTVDTMGANSILTASDDGTFSLWDMRAMSSGEAPLVLSGDSMSHGRKWTQMETGPVVSAFFSPQGGSRLLTSCKNLISVFNHGHNLQPFKTYSTCGTGYFAQKDCRQRAYWHPLRRDVLLFSLSLHPMTGVGISHARTLPNRSRFPCAPDIHLRDARSITEAIFHQPS